MAVELFLKCMVFFQGNIRKALYLAVMKDSLCPENNCWTCPRPAPNNILRGLVTGACQMYSLQKNTSLFQIGMDGYAAEGRHIGRHAMLEMIPAPAPSTHASRYMQKS